MPGASSPRSGLTGRPGPAVNPMHELSAPLHLEYNLSKADVRHYCSAGLAWRCWKSCRGRKAALLLLVVLVCLILGTCVQAHGLRVVWLVLGTTLIVVALLAVGREVVREWSICRVARLMGFPRVLRIVVSHDGIFEESGPRLDDAARMFAWSEVVDVSRMDHLTVIRLRPAGGVLIVPDSAFSSPDGRAEFEEAVRVEIRSTRR